ncbi:MAG: FecR domain-containing protein [Bacteroidales bacterium]
MSDFFEKRLLFIARYFRPGRLDADKAWLKFASAKNIPASSFPTRNLLAIASVVILLISGGTWWFTRSDWQQVSTGKGQIAHIYLPDSTLITLAPDSKLRYDKKSYGKTEREVSLLGKAFFEVRPNPKAPFCVEAQMTRVTVLGTSFQINEKEKSIEVNVVTGKVRFEVPEKKEQLILTAGMSASYSMGTGSLASFREETANRVAWKTNVLRFHATPLDEVLRTLEEHYHCKLQLVSQKTDREKELKLTATFEDMTLAETILIIEQTLDIKLYLQNPRHF